jgi:excisionase family DNA binding protein
MAGKFLDLKEAAKLLNISPEELVEMRSRGEIFGYRDGASWKFKSEEVDRVLAERSTGDEPKTGSDILGSSEDDFNADFLLDEPKSGSTGSDQQSQSDMEHSDLQSEADFGSDQSHSDVLGEESDDSLLVADDDFKPRKSSVIGGDRSQGLDSDLKLSDTPEPSKSGSRDVLSDSLSGDVGKGSGLSSGLTGESADVDYDLAPDGGGELSAGLSAGMSSSARSPQSSELTGGNLSGGASLAGGTLSGQSLSGASLGGDSLDLVGSAAGGSAGGSVTGSEVHGSDIMSDIQTADDESALGGASSVGSGLDHGGTLDLDLGSAIGGADMSDGSMSVGGDDDSISLDFDSPGGEGSFGGSQSDITYRPGESGINLKSPSDSGISLEEEPLDLGGSAVEPMELGEDQQSSEDVIALDEEEADPEVATQLKADEAFSLSPVPGMGEDDLDSGSQVIALEDSVAAPFGMAAGATALRSGASGSLASAMEAAGMGSDPGFQALELEPAPGMGTASSLSGMQRMMGPVEIPYSIWNVLGLLLTAGTLGLSGLIMLDVMWNMWSFHEPGKITTGITETLFSALGIK